MNPITTPHAGIKPSRTYTLSPSPMKDIDSLIQDPDIWPFIQSAVDEAVRAKAKITQEQEQIKALRDMTRDRFGLHPKLFNAYVAATFNNDYVQRLDGVTQEQVLLEHIMGEAGVVRDADD